MSDQPLVSIIVPTRNNADTIAACLQSIVDQTHPAIELIVIDRDSGDDTKAIAERFTPQVTNHGPERSAQRNLGAAKATGDYLFFVDSDMILDPAVVADCLAQMASKPVLAAVNIPETSFGRGFWAQCKALERSYYNGVTWVECPRFVTRAVFEQAGGYNEQVSGGEDWELTRRLMPLGPFGRVQSGISHDEGRVQLRDLVRKRVRLYGEGWAMKGGPNHYADGPRLLALYLSRPQVIAAHPLTWTGMMYMRSLEMSARAYGYYRARSKSKSKSLNWR
jgi:glycosyltransferase involved in cell wall biosynthesis